MVMIMIMVMVMVMVAFMIVMVVVMSMSVPGPRRERVRKTPPGYFAWRHFSVAEETTVESILEPTTVNPERHNGEGLTAVAERFAPLFSGPVGHLGFARFRIARYPPMTG